MLRPPLIQVQKSQIHCETVVPSPRSDLAALFNQGLALHQQGQLDQAMQIYTQVLAKQPDYYDALHFVGVIKTAHKEYPIEQCRWCLVGEDRGKYVVFKSVEENNVWAVGWSDIQFKTYICTQRDSHHLGRRAGREKEAKSGWEELPN
jgi:tetratricopeptide (TPR) repeat protein